MSLIHVTVSNGNKMESQGNKQQERRLTLGDKCLKNHITAEE
jgi:hypothetical protein